MMDVDDRKVGSLRSFATHERMIRASMLRGSFSAPQSPLTKSV